MLVLECFCRQKLAQNEWRFGSKQKHRLCIKPAILFN